MAQKVEEACPLGFRRAASGTKACELSHGVEQHVQLCARAGTHHRQLQVQYVQLQAQHGQLWAQHVQLWVQHVQLLARAGAHHVQKSACDELFARVMRLAQCL